MGSQKFHLSWNIHARGPLMDIYKKGLSHDQIEKSGCTAAFLSEKRKKLGSGRVFLNYDVL